MRYAAMFLLLSGCALHEAQTGADRFDVASREPVCARGCLQNYGACTNGVAGTGNRFVANDMLAACNANTQQCLSTCPKK